MSDTIESLLAEGRTFLPPPEFKRQALVTDAEIYDEATADPQGFWALQASQLLDWYEEWHTILEWNLPFAKWFVGGKLNAAYNCLDRHVDAGHGDQVRIHAYGRHRRHARVGGIRVQGLDAQRRHSNRSA